MPKQFALLGGASVLARTVSCFEQHPGVDRIIIAVHPEWIDDAVFIVKQHGFKKVTGVIAGGSTRQESSAAAVTASGINDEDILLIHDAARPFVSFELISNVIKAASEYGAAVPALKATDTVIETDSSGKIIRYPDRAGILLCQTPQGFRRKIIVQALEAAGKTGNNASDDSGLVFAAGGTVVPVAGDPRNIKITLADDFPAAELILKNGYDFLLDSEK
jgi:2-C-methyl-D-erythritol 4-phosphate cytidylyltransferase